MFNIYSHYIHLIAALLFRLMNESLSDWEDMSNYHTVIYWLPLVFRKGSNECGFCAPIHPHLILGDNLMPRNEANWKLYTRLHYFSLLKEHAYTIITV